MISTFTGNVYSVYIIICSGNIYHPLIFIALSYVNMFPVYIEITSTNIYFYNI